MPKRLAFLLPLLAGGLSATGFAPLGLWPMTLLGFAVWIVIIFKQSSTPKAFLTGWLFGVGHFVIGLNWIAKAFTFQATMPEWLGWVAVVLLALYLAVYPALAALGAWWLANRSLPFRGWEKSGNRLGVDASPAPPPPSVAPLPMPGRIGLSSILLLAGFWTIAEWLRSWVFTGFAWNPLGAVTVPLGVLPMASTLIGTYGLSLLVILGAGGLLLLWQRCWIAGLALVVPLALAAIVPATSIPAPADTETLITVIQPNIEQQDKWQAGVEEANFAKMARLTKRKDPAPRLIFWPEAAIPDYLEAGYPRRYYYGRDVVQVRGELAALMQPGDILVLGGLKLEFGRDREGGPIKAIGARNSVFAMDQQQKLLGSYDKAHLVPYGEYLPMRPVLSALGLSRLAPGDLDFWPGPGPSTLDLGQRTAMGIQVCYEIIFSGQVVDRDNRPGFIFNPSNDAWFGAWGPPQHLAQARLRAIEEGLPVIRSTPTGISAVIDARGQVRAGVPMAQSGRIDTVLPSPRTATPFALWGNILPLLLAAITIISAIAIGRQRR